ncbi:hypothetical protein FEM48_Zijuj06G0035400 [Ziziphus jujuba var. spinosa]|uniref:C2HC zinc finger plants domain-containing protein n=1 Tax=Ziziphus jujuba var. spinosa TaxID=714518 RepID=A0A978V6X4_ZIZJJ|nr:hypothetical protein FEM48_Zijuj06G0035400 [Ziziphus jujuba var. spinosa]
MEGGEIMETETAIEQQQQPQAASNSNSNAVRDLLTMARQLINQGKPSQALQAGSISISKIIDLGFGLTLSSDSEDTFLVVMAMRTTGGDDAVFQSLHRARELYKSRLRENAAVDQLASLFAECAIAEVQPLKTEPSADYRDDSSLVHDAHVSSILAETGRTQIVLDAFSDGSSFICLQCGGLVSNHRKEEHYTYWCCQV